MAYTTGSRGGRVHYGSLMGPGKHLNQDPRKLKANNSAIPKLETYIF